MKVFENYEMIEIKVSVNAASRKQVMLTWAIFSLCMLNIQSGNHLNKRSVNE